MHSAISFSRQMKKVNRNIARKKFIIIATILMYPWLFMYKVVISTVMEAKKTWAPIRTN